MTNFNIKAEELAQELEITLTDLYEIVDFFDSNSEDEWELTEGVDFKFTNKHYGIRVFSEQGAYSIAKYVQLTQKKPIWKRVKDWVSGKNKKVLAKRVENSLLEKLSTKGSVIIQGERTFFPNKDTKEMLGTSYPRLKKAFTDIQHSEFPLAIDEDFLERDNKKYYSGSGVVKLARNLSQTLTSKNRREWCKEIEYHFPKVIKALDSQEAAREKRIKAACDQARRRDKNTCQITGEKPSRVNKFNLATHHLFSKADYPNLADSLDNLITLKEEIHNEFHLHMGGNQVPCTIDDFIKFVIENYPEADLLKLNNLKSKFHHVK